ncbi:hypothetical protein PF005_g19988 [Phytophthora fragariae]|uniref:Uncharacterized protein n=1 Tax=Phytophthora fragariae TaxID=53985 RepID=A0A6A3IN24_9STRA|nr:hypothetical protein PF003_g1640 [Phytophthora fragariae]KAE8934821.1 hypothetical protein PF009_g15217 [Phytophthora fragariae]KAE8980973.1 hypothetical protein PF011_g22218 [Phytophthora fragariae]KAE9078945.1 hypothetical protein PF010_g22944 [Phytophthora fragariae]KAE9099574.1 hypothetical protein PF006_g23104 [Phytophthora fragariae]
MARKWFQLTGEDGSALTSATSVRVDVEDVDTFQDAVKAKFKGSRLAWIASSDLTIFANQAAFHAKQKLPKSSSSVTGLGNDEVNALIVVVPDADDGDEASFFSLLQYFRPSSRSLEKTLETKKDV